MKMCRRCGEEFPATLEYFPPEKKVKSGLAARCRKCTRETANASARRLYTPKPRQSMRKPETKRCPQCQSTFPFTEEHFYRNSANHWGLHVTCKQCSREARRTYYGNNREAALEYAAEYMRSPEARERRRHKQREQRAKDPERYRAYARAWYQANLEKARAERREYAATHSAAAVKRAKKWNAAHPEVRRVNGRRYYARKKGVAGHHSAQDIQMLLEQQAFRCYYCNDHASICGALEADHIIPLARTELNPTNDISNIAMACRSCNARKSDKTPEEWTDRWYLHPPECSCGCQSIKQSRLALHVESLVGIGDPEEVPERLFELEHDVA